MTKEAKNIWIIAGETSGDIYGAAIIRELRKLTPDIKISGMGGPAMIKENIDLKIDSTELGVMGFVEVLKLLFTFIRVFTTLVKAALKERPDGVLLIDYPGFNLLFALVMYFNKIKVIWYVCPQVWVWGKWRKPIFAKICTKMMVIFPFETEVFSNTKLDSEFVGHPLLDIVASHKDNSIKKEPNCFILLPGSRVMEINRMLEPMLETISSLAEKHPELYFVLPTPREKIQRLCTEIYDKYKLKNPKCPKLDISCSDIGKCLQVASTGLATSGTVTVECAIAKVPLVVGYKLNLLTIIFASLVVKLYRGFFTMVNIIANKCVFEEFLQFDFTAKKLVPAIERILPKGDRRSEVESGMEEVTLDLTPKSESAAKQAAECIIKTIN